MRFLTERIAYNTTLAWTARVCLALLILTACFEQATATLYWDANGAGGGTGGTGDWNTTDLVWRDGGTGGTLQAWVDNNDVNLPTTAGTLTLKEDITVGQNGTSTLISGVSGYTINADPGFSLTLDATGGTGPYRISTNAGNLLINAPVILMGYDQNPRGNVTFAGDISESGGSYALVKNLVGTTMTLNGNNTFSGGMNLSQGSLIVGHNNALGTGNLSWGNGTTLSAGGGDRTLSNDVSGSWNYLHTIAGTNNLTFSGNYNAMSAFASGFWRLNIVEAGTEATFSDFTTQTSGSPEGFKKQGDGTMILEGTVTQTSGGAMDFTIEDGIVLFNTTSASLANIIVNTGGTLGGTGTINPGGSNTVTIDAGGTIAAGASVGTLTIDGDVVINGTLENELSGSTTDLLAITGDLTLGASSILNFSGTPDGTTDYTFLTFTGTLTGTFDTVATPAGYVLEYGANSLTLSAVPVPEPSTAILLGISVTLPHVLRRRRRKV